MGEHGTVDTEGTPALGPTEHRLRLSGSEEAPPGRGLLHLGALVVALPAGALLVWRQGPGGGVGLYAAALVGLYAEGPVTTCALGGPPPAGACARSTMR